MIDYSNLDKSSTSIVLTFALLHAEDASEMEQSNKELIEEVLGYLVELNPAFRRSNVWPAIAIATNLRRPCAPRDSIECSIHEDAYRSSVHGGHLLLLPEEAAR